MADDQTSDDRKDVDLMTTVLKRVLADPSAVEYAQQQTKPDAQGRILAGYNGAGTMRVWFGAMHGCTTQYAAKAPEHSGPAEVFVRGILEVDVDGVELVDADGNQLTCSVQAVGRPVVEREETTLDLVSWLHEQIALLRATALAALRGWPFEDPGGSDRDGDFWHSHQDALYQGPRPDHPVGGKAIADFPQAPYAATFAARFDPQAALAQCESHTAILQIHHDDGEGCCTGCSTFKWGEPWAPPLDDCPTLCAAALAYQHCPGFREGWRLDHE